MRQLFALLKTNGESLTLSFHEGLGHDNPSTITHLDFKNRKIKSELKGDYQYLAKYFMCDSEYLRFLINDLKFLLEYIKHHNKVELYYLNNTTNKMEAVYSTAVAQDKLNLIFKNGALYYALAKKSIAYDINQLTAIGTNYIQCNEQNIFFIFFDIPNIPLFRLLTNYKTPKMNEAELKVEIRQNKIKNISFANYIDKTNIIKRLVIKQTTFKTQAKSFFSLSNNSSLQWSENDENMVLQISESEIAIRDKNLEIGYLQEIKNEGFYKTGDTWNLLNGNAEVVFLRLNALGWVIQKDEKEFVQEFTFFQGRLELVATFKENWFEVSGEFKADSEILPLDFIFSKIKNGEKKVLLSNNRYVIIDDMMMSKIKSFLPFYQADSQQFHLPLYMAHQIETDNEAVLSIRRDQHTEDFLKSLNDFKNIEKVEPPPTLKIELRDYQKDGLNWLAFLNHYHLGGILADDMGLGKTAQIISLLLHKKKIKGFSVNLIIAPKSLLFNWEAEVLKFTDDLKVVKYYGNDRVESLKIKDVDIILTTYGTIRNDFEILSNIFFDGIFLDESQSIKNHQSKSFHCIQQLKGRMKVCITGTPIENHIGELWSQLKFALPALLDSHSSFIYQFLKSPTEEGLREFKKIIFPFILRRKKEDVAKELPAKVEQTITCDMTPKQWAFYENIRAGVRNDLFSQVDASGISRSTMHILEALLRLRQAACHTSLIMKNEEVGESGKLQSLISMIEEVYGENHKILIFSQFIQMLSIIGKELALRNIPYHYLDGKTNNRGEVVNDFQNQTSAGVFLISLKAGGVGLNLTAADYVFIFDPWWNPAVEMQAIDRTHRIGQTKTVFAYRMISKGSVEEKIMLLKERKKHIADLVITAEKSLIQELTREDLEFLFS